MGSAAESRPRKLVNLRTVLMAMVAASIVVMIGLAMLDDLRHNHNQSPPTITITTITSNSSSSSSSIRSSASLIDPPFQQEVKEALQKLGQEVSSMRVKMEEGSGHTAAEVSAVKKLLRRSVLMRRRRRRRRRRGGGGGGSFRRSGGDGRNITEQSGDLEQSGDSDEYGDGVDSLDWDGEEAVAAAEEESMVVMDSRDWWEFRPLHTLPPQIMSGNPANFDDHVYHRFLSLYRGRGLAEGPPELLVFPSIQDPISLGRLLCIRGNHTFRGSENHYAFARPDTLPPSASLVPGTTLVADTLFDFSNPWHSMYNLFQFLFWRFDSSASPSSCPTASNLLLFHAGEYRTSLGPWISGLFSAFGLPTSVLRLDAHVVRCFQQAVVARCGIGGMRRPMLRRMFDEARCRARASCDILIPPRTHSPHVNITLIVREAGRNFIDKEAWKQVIHTQCEKAGNCSWSTMHVDNLTLCEQVKAISYSDILVSAHGAQLTNMIFMSPGGRIMEMFPKGWLELAGHGQFIYRNLASWAGLRHEGYWRDPSTPTCANPSDSKACFHHYKDQPIGINITYIGDWLGDVISDVKSTIAHSNPILGQPTNACECSN